MSYFNSISECPAEQDIISHRKGQTSAEPCVINIKLPGRPPSFVQLPVSCQQSVFPSITTKKLKFVR